MDVIFHKDDAIVWLRKTSKGWHPVHHIAARFVSYAGQRAVIDAVKNDGTTTRHRVSLDSIRKG